MGGIDGDAAETARYYGLLDEYYARNVGGHSRCVCAQLDLCRASAGADHFAAAQLSFVGSRYAMRHNGRPWQIVVVSMQTGETESPISMARRREQFQDRVGEQLGQRNAHIRGVTTALRLLWGREPGTDEEGELLATPQGPVHMLDAHALVNATLCARVRMAKSRAGHGSAAMHDNCVSHLRAALSILEPTIVHSQGRRAARGSPTPHRSLLSVFDEISWQDEHVAIARLGDHRMVWVSLGHPSARGRSAWSHVTSPFLAEVVRPALGGAREAAIRIGAESAPDPGPGESAVRRVRKYP